MQELIINQRTEMQASSVKETIVLEECNQDAASHDLEMDINVEEEDKSKR